MFRLRPSLDFNLIKKILSIIKRKLFDKMFLMKQQTDNIAKKSHSKVILY